MVYYDLLVQCFPMYIANADEQMIRGMYDNREVKINSKPSDVLAALKEAVAEAAGAFYARDADDILSLDHASVSSDKEPFVLMNHPNFARECRLSKKAAGNPRWSETMPFTRSAPLKDHPSARTSTMPYFPVKAIRVSTQGLYNFLLNCNSGDSPRPVRIGNQALRFSPFEEHPEKFFYRVPEPCMMLEADFSLLIAGVAPVEDPEYADLNDSARLFALVHAINYQARDSFGISCGRFMPLRRGDPEEIRQVRLHVEWCNDRMSDEAIVDALNALGESLTLFEEPFPFSVSLTQPSEQPGRSHEIRRDRKPDYRKQESRRDRSPEPRRHRKQESRRDRSVGRRQESRRDPRQEPRRDRSPEPRQQSRRDRSPAPRQEPRRDRSPEPRQEPRRDRSPAPKQAPRRYLSPEPKQEPRRYLSPEPKQEPQPGPSQEQSVESQPDSDEIEQKPRQESQSDSDEVERLSRALKKKSSELDDLRDESWRQGAQIIELTRKLRDLEPLRDMARDVGERHQYRNFTDLVDDLTSARDTALADLDAATKHCDQAISELMTATDERDKAQAELAVTTDERDKAQAELALRDARIAALESAAGAILGLAQGVLHGN
jgi:hypothetical protein